MTVYEYFLLVSLGLGVIQGRWAQTFMQANAQNVTQETHNKGRWEVRSTALRCAVLQDYSSLLQRQDESG